jgi:hypothetical protein
MAIGAEVESAGLQSDGRRLNSRQHSASCTDFGQFAPWKFATITDVERQHSRLITEPQLLDHTRQADA